MKDIDYLKTFRLYISLKQHFNIENKYQHNPSNKMEKLNIETFLKRRDQKFFITLTQKYHPDQFEYLLSMFLKNPDMWIGEMIDNKNIHYHEQRMSRIRNLEYTVRSELYQLLETYNKPLDKLLDDNYNIPLIAKNKNISLETLSIVNKIKNFTSHDTLNPLWNIKRIHINNYSKLIHIPEKINEYVLDL